MPYSGTETEGSAATAGDKLLDVLSAFIQQPTWELGTLAASLQLPKSTTHRIVSTLRRHGYLRQIQGSGEYVLGLSSYLLTVNSSYFSALRKSVHSALVHLSESSLETAMFSAFSGSQGILIDQVEPLHPIRFSVGIGSVVDLTAGASGKVLLAYCDEGYQKDYLKQLPKEKRFSLKLDLEQIQCQGYVFTDSEVTIGTSAVAVPVFDRFNQLLGGLILGGPSGRLTSETAQKHLPTLYESADNIRRNTT